MGIDASQWNYDVRRTRIEAEQKELLSSRNSVIVGGSGFLNRFASPILTRDHIPLEWRFDLARGTNPFFLERLAVNAAFNPGALMLGDRVHLIVRVEGADRKSFFARAASKDPVSGFEFTQKPLEFARIGDETNLYDMRLTAHEDGFVYGVFCTERKDPAKPDDLSAAIAQSGIVRTQDLEVWERLPNLQTESPQQRNCVLHPEFVDGKYAFYTRPQDGFIETGSGGGIGFGLVDDIKSPIIHDEQVINTRAYHTIKEAKNGQGAPPLKTSLGWLHVAHGVRETAAGLRYVLYAFLTALDDPRRVVAEPGGYVLAPQGDERIGDVSNVLFVNGMICKDDIVYLYYASSDTRTHVACAPLEVFLDYVVNTPADSVTTHGAARVRRNLIERNGSPL